jgi:hypothetical protein
MRGVSSSLESSLIVLPDPHVCKNAKTIGYTKSRKEARDRILFQAHSILFMHACVPAAIMIYDLVIPECPNAPGNM